MGILISIVEGVHQLKHYHRSSTSMYNFNLALNFKEKNTAKKKERRNCLFSTFGQMIVKATQKSINNWHFIRQAFDK